MIENPIAESDVERTPPLIAIDGPAGSGKSTTARAVAQKLGIPYLDTGAMYRAVTVAVLDRGENPENRHSVEKLIERSKFSFKSGASATRVWIDNTEVTDKLRTPHVTKAVGPVCEIHAVRQVLVRLQRFWARRGFGVMEGRDIGTVVLPGAELKIYLTAKPEVRALRRSIDLGIQDDEARVKQLAEDIAARDKRDMSRDDSPLRKADDAVELDTSEMSFTEQVNCIVGLASERFGIKVYGS